MKTLEQLAQDAYGAYCKKAIEVDEEGLAEHAQAWSELDPGTQACWVAAANQLWAEFATLQCAGVSTASESSQEGQNPIPNRPKEEIRGNGATQGVSGSQAAGV